jgi:hypothetical protein
MRKRQHRYDSKSASEAAKKRWGAQPEDTPEAPTIPSTPVETLRQLSLDPNVPSYARVNAAKALAALEPPEPEHRWQDSPQVQPGYTPPTWPEVIAYAKSIGAYDDD